MLNTALPPSITGTRPLGAVLQEMASQSPSPVRAGAHLPAAPAPAVSPPNVSANYGALLADALGPRPEMSRGQRIASVVAPMLLAASGNASAAQQAIAGIGAQGREWDQQHRAAALEAARWQREDDQAQARRNEPQFFSGTEDRVRFDPATGETTRIYDAPADYEDYAATQGYAPGTPEYFAAVEDYVLRGNGPTAFQYDRDLETLRAASRQSLEAARQRNRVGLIDYRNANPPPSRARSAGRATPSRRPANIPVVRSAAEARNLPAGTQFRTPDGRTMRVPR